MYYVWWLLHQNIVTVYFRASSSTHIPLLPVPLVSICVFVFLMFSGGNPYLSKLSTMIIMAFCVS